jgi:hypothetical protein
MINRWTLAAVAGPLLAICLACGALTQAEPEPAAKAPDPAKAPSAPPKDGQPTAQPGSGAGAPIATADDLLKRLETADKDIKSLSAGMQYDRVFGLAGDRQVRTGKLHYVDTKVKDDKGQPAPGSRKFAIKFEQLKLGEQGWRPENKIMVFDGHWLIEKMPADKQMIKREVVPAGKAFDPLKIGEGPFPVPIGQKRDDILKRFDAQLLPAEDGIVGNVPGDTQKLKDFVTKAKAYQLKLTPKPGQDQDFKEVRLWYAPQEGTGVLLPVMARTVNQQDDVSVVELVDVKVNEEPPADVFDAQAPDGWAVTVEELRQEIRR